MKLEKGDIVELIDTEGLVYTYIPNGAIGIVVEIPDSLGFLEESQNLLGIQWVHGASGIEGFDNFGVYGKFRFKKVTGEKLALLKLKL